MRPTLRLERRIVREGATVVACVDEVGRGALAGPVTVGVVVSALDARPPRGIRDSKALTPARREALAPLIHEWATAWAVGHSSAREIDALGILGALRVATMRALAAVAVQVDAIVLDGSHDFLTAGHEGAVGADTTGAMIPRVITVIGGDQRCTGVAAASIVAKCARDTLMNDLAAQYPHFAWDRNKGYGTREHRAALASSGVSDEHRRTWRLLE